MTEDQLDEGSREAFSFDQALIEPIDKMLQDIREDKERLEKKVKEIKERNDEIRDFIYVQYDITSFPKDLPKEFKEQEELLKLFDALNDGVGYAIRVVLKYRYAEPRVVTEQRDEKGRVHNPTVVVQQPQQPPGLASGITSRVQSWWTGFHEVRLQRELLQYLREKEAETPRITTSKVVRDPVEIGNEISAVLVETKKFVVDCFRCLPAHRNRWFVVNVHDELRERATKLLSVLEAFVVACTEIDLKDLRRQQIAQTAYFARIAEARAMMPTPYMPPYPERPQAPYGVYRPGRFEE